MSYYHDTNFLNRLDFVAAKKITTMKHEVHEKNKDKKRKEEVRHTLENSFLTKEQMMPLSSSCFMRAEEVEGGNAPE